MAAAMNGMALHGGVIPYGGTFLVFTDYCRPSIRLAALMGPSGHLRDDPRFDRAGRRRPDPPAGRAPGGAARHSGLKVMRPADAIETAECWQLALESKNKPSVIALTRQNLPTLRGADDANLLRPGGLPAGGDAGGCCPADRLRLGGATRCRGARSFGQGRYFGRGRLHAVVGAVRWCRTRPIGGRSWAATTQSGSPAKRAGGFGWERWLGTRGTFVGMKGFGASRQGRRPI